MQVLKVETTHKRIKMNRNTRKVLDYISHLEKQVKQMSYVKHLKKEVEINGTGTHKYRLKCGPNKGKVL
tara:strand:+ start:198 stop:404 length:207 start_codon:yes stop_codon:yes gene_type:complete